MTNAPNPAFETLSFAWWNTSLTPRGGSATIEQQRIAARLIEVLIGNIGVDFIALGEVSLNERDVYAEVAQSFGYNLLDGFSKAGRSQFRMLFLYRSERLNVSDPFMILAKKGNRTLRIAQRVDVFIDSNNKPLHIFISHWRSRLHLAEDAPDRNLLGLRLRDAVDEVYKQYQVTPNVILMGDYNDEPFSKSLTDHLRATRDRDLATRKTDLLYNPFWRYLEAPCEIVGRNIPGGTYFHASGELTKWRLFDQLIVSSSFLTNNDWVLDEYLTQIINVPNYVQLLWNRKERFDHVPIVGVFRRYNNGD